MHFIGEISFQLQSSRSPYSEPGEVAVTPTSKVIPMFWL